MTTSVDNFFTIYGAIIHLKMLEDKNINSDDKWEYYKNIITCRFINFNHDFHTYDNIGLRTHLIHKEYCIFELWHKNYTYDMNPPPPSSYNLRYALIVYKNTDKVCALAIKYKNIIKLNKFNHDNCKILIKFIKFSLKKQISNYR